MLATRVFPTGNLVKGGVLHRSFLTGSFDLERRSYDLTRIIIISKFQILDPYWQSELALFSNPRSLLASHS